MEYDVTPERETPVADPIDLRQFSSEEIVELNDALTAAGAERLLERLDRALEMLPLVDLGKAREVCELFTQSDVEENRQSAAALLPQLAELDPVAAQRLWQDLLAQEDEALNAEIRMQIRDAIRDGGLSSDQVPPSLRPTDI
ncbi:hypothetical protein OG394_14155 [Kribbella sp. NBC_01245]|uniref:hypothetical protein n=1 Tax=Kribbella sp. NBC_01245 TaxID=2903578 RepID=UPI002E28FF5B|nr:hypothetical protein [Kribbella sp. NBC_01245]